MRKPCLACTLKHLASAEIAEQEYMMGYPSHLRLVVGHLDHAATECFGVNQALAWIIREHRLQWTDRPRTWHVPYEALCNYVGICEMVPTGSALPAVPDDCYGEIPRDVNGDPELSGDTRP